MTKMSDAEIPSLTLEEVLSDGSTLTNPAADHRRLFLGEDGLLHLRDSSGTVTDLGGGDLSDQGTFTFLDGAEAAAPSTPASGKVRLYAKTDGLLYSKDDAGAETLVSGGAAGGGAPTDAEYIVGAANGSLSAEKVRRDLYKNYNPDAYPATFNAVSNEFDGGGGGSYSWTTTPGSSDENTTFPGYLYIVSNVDQSGTIYKYRAAYAPGSTDFTVVASIELGHRIISTNKTFQVGIALLDSGDATIWETRLLDDAGGEGLLAHRLFDTNASTLTSAWGWGHRVYTMIQRTSGNVYTAYWSINGRAWLTGGSSTVATTVAKVAATVNSGSTGATTPTVALFDFIRVFDSLTFKIGA